MAMRRSPSQFLVAFGTATLVAGSAANVAPGCLTNPNLCTILLSRNTPGGTLGFLGAPSMGRSEPDITFDILSSNSSDTSTVNWIAIPKNPGLKAALLSSNNFPADGSLRKPPSGLFVAKGTATLAGGTVTVTVGKPFTSNARAFVMARTRAGTTGKLSAPQASLNPTTNQFVINSNSGSDTSTVDWILFDEFPRFSPSGPRMSQARGTLGASFTNGAAFDGMIPMPEDVCVIASVIDAAGTQGNLGCAENQRSTLTGQILVDSSAAETSTIEVAAF